MSWPDRDRYDAMALQIQAESDRRKMLSSILDSFDIPDRVRDLSSLRNLQWLGRNMGINNGDHPEFDTAKQLLRDVMRDARKG